MSWFAAGSFMHHSKPQRNSALLGGALLGGAWLIETVQLDHKNV
jgi:hypothetical protein